jgi:hypothetical protein
MVSGEANIFDTVEGGGGGWKLKWLPLTYIADFKKSHLLNSLLFV